MKLSDLTVGQRVAVKLKGYLGTREAIVLDFGWEVGGTKWERRFYKSGLNVAVAVDLHPYNPNRFWYPDVVRPQQIKESM